VGLTAATIHVKLGFARHHYWKLDLNFT
jgi:hypothetical protein